MTQAAITQAPAVASSHVAPLLPPTAPPPEPARRIHFIKALLLFWLLPRRYGPHLAVGSFRRAFTAHLISVVVGFIAISPATPPDTGQHPFSSMRCGSKRRKQSSPRPPSPPTNDRLCGGVGGRWRGSTD